MLKQPYRILVVDDSSVIRQAIVAIINSHDNLQVIGEATNGYEALKLIKQLKPDLVTLDVIMPKMSGLTTLKYIMIFYPTPVVMLSSLTKAGAAITFDALRYGAVDFIAKPSKLDNNSLRSQSNEIIQKILSAVKVKINAIQYIRVKPKQTNISLPKISAKHVVVLGVAEGGYATLLKIIPRLLLQPLATYLIVFYESAIHINGFIEYLNQYSQVLVTRTQDNTILQTGVCYLSLGEEYVTVHEQQNHYRVHVSHAPFSSRRGSIDMLMFSVAESLGKRALGVILTGAGSDGAEGLEELIRVGGGAIIQAPISCLHKSMALSALNTCEAETVVVDTEIATEINYFLKNLQS
ncbi:MAG: chemotaxis protein CheB [Methylococcaceae bacterium]